MPSFFVPVASYSWTGRRGRDSHPLLFQTLNVLCLCVFSPCLFLIIFMQHWVCVVYYIFLIFPKDNVFWVPNFRSCEGSEEVNTRNFAQNRVARRRPCGVGTLNLNLR